MTNTIWQFASSPNIKFGRGCRRFVSEQLSRHSVRRALIVTDTTVASQTVVKNWLAELAQSNALVIFDQCSPEPTVEVAQSACQFGISAQVDGVIGVGGGSNLDVAKVVATVLMHGGQPADYFGFDRIAGPVVPLFALPTTAGTGSEVSHSAVLTDVKNGVKVSTLSPWLRPLVAFVDPELSDSCPPRVTAHSGIDALVHAVEAYSNRDYSEMVGVDPQARAYEGSYPLTRLLALEAIRLIAGSLAVAVAQPDHTTARDNMALAALLAGMAFSNSGVGIVHALEYPIGALTHCGHGEGNGLLLPHVMRYNLEACRSQYERISVEMAAGMAGAATDSPSRSWPWYCPTPTQQLVCRVGS
jgi:alcohol dehydrogenase class IV